MGLGRLKRFLPPIKPAIKLPIEALILKQNTSRSGLLRFDPCSDCPTDYSVTASEGLGAGS